MATNPISDSLAKLTRDPRQLRHLSQSVVLEEVGPSRVVRGIMMLIAISVLSFIAWASVASLKQTTKATGEVVPDGSVMAIQHLEGGIVSEILVRDGDLVDNGQVLIRMDPTASTTQLDEIRTHGISLAVRLTRLRAFAENKKPDFGDTALKYPDLVSSELAIFRQQTDALAREKEVLDAQWDQRVSDLDVLESQLGKQEKQLKVAAERKDLHERLVRTGLVSKIVYLQSLEQYQRAFGEVNEMKGKIERARGAIQEAESKLQQLDSSRRNDAQDQAGKVAAELASVRETITRLKDRVDRLDVRAPVRGVIKGLATHTVGGVVAPGGQITDIVPAGQNLIVEARISPIDIGHISTGDAATVKITTFDFARFGSIEGRVSRISATTFKDREEEIYYKAQIVLAQNYVGSNPERNLILPGMVTEIDINTGERTVLEYLLRPIFVSLNTALSER